MCETVNWEAVSAISNVLMTAATFAAVFVALFSSRIEARRAIKVLFYSNTFSP